MSADRKEAWWKGQFEKANREASILNFSLIKACKQLEQYTGRPSDEIYKEIYSSVEKHYQ